MAEIFANNAAGVLAAEAVDTDTSITLESGHTFPAPGTDDFFRATLWEVSGGEEANHEIVYVTDVTNDVATVERAKEGTTARTWSAGTGIELRLTAHALDGLPATEKATDGGTDAYASSRTTTPPPNGSTIKRDFQSANETTTPELDGITITTKDGSALWANALSGVHELQYASSGPAWRVVNPNRSPGAVNVQWFGAHPDNSATVNASAIQDAIDAVSDGGAVYIPAGVYDIDSTLTNVNTGIALYGDGPGSPRGTSAQRGTELRWTGATSTDMIRFGDGGTINVFRCVVRDIALNGNDTASIIAFNLDSDCKHFSFERVLVFNANTCWLLGTSCFSCRWYDCEVENFGADGWRLRDKDNACFWSGCRASGGSTKSPNYTVRAGEDVRCNQLSFHACDFEHWNVGSQILVYDSDGVDLSGGYFEAKDGNTAEIVQLGTDTTSVDAFSITGSRMIGSGACPNAIHLRNCSNGFVAGNHSAGFTTNFILATAGAVFNVLLGPNTIGSGMTEASNYSSITTIRGDSAGFFGQSPTAARGYNVVNLSLDRSLNADSTDQAELADVLGTLITDLIEKGIIQQS